MRLRPLFLLGLILLLAGVAMSAHARKESAEKAASGFVKQLETGAYEMAWERMSPDMRAALTMAMLKQTWESLASQLGEYKASGEPVVSHGSPVSSVKIPLSFANGSLDASIAVDASGTIAGLHFLPPASDGGKSSNKPRETSDNGVSREVLIGRGGGVPGTLLMPVAQDRPVPVVLLVPGSGPQDRDGTVGQNHPYADIANGLAALGIATLRFDKRTRVHPDEFRTADITLDEEVGNDVAAAVNELVATPGIDPERIYLFGHSLGGVAAIGAADVPSVAGLVLFAVPSRPILDLLQAQVTYVANVDGKADSEEVKRIQELRGQISRVRSGDTSASIFSVPAKYWVDLEKRDTVAGVLRLHKPVLLLQGGRDYQVTSADWSIWQERVAGRSAISLREYPTLNHLGISGDVPSNPDEYLRPGQVDQELIREVAEWILANQVVADRSAGR